MQKQTDEAKLLWIIMPKIYTFRTSLPIYKLPFHIHRTRFCNIMNISGVLKRAETCLQVQNSHNVLSTNVTRIQLQ